MTPRLLDESVARIDEHERQVGRRTTGDHVARVLDVPRGVRDDELAFWRCEIPVGDVDGDALLAFGPEAVGQKGEIRVLVATLRR